MDRPDKKTFEKLNRKIVDLVDEIVLALSSVHTNFIDSDCNLITLELLNGNKIDDFHLTRISNGVITGYTIIDVDNENAKGQLLHYINYSVDDENAKGQLLHYVNYSVDNVTCDTLFNLIACYEKSVGILK